LLLFSVLYGFCAANYTAFNGEVVREGAEQFLALAEKQKTNIPIMNGHRLVGVSLLHTGDIAEGREHLDRAIAIYDPSEHRSLVTRFGADVGVVILYWRALAIWLLGHPEAARADIDHALRYAREIGHAATLAYALIITAWTHVQCGNFVAAKAQADEAVALADEKGASYLKMVGVMTQGCVCVLTGQAQYAVQSIASSIASYRSTGATVSIPFFLSGLAVAHAQLGEYDDARRCIGEAVTAVETSRERWGQAEIHRTAGEIELISPEHDAVKAEAYFEHALAVARAQQARSWELRAAMSLARLWRDQEKRQQAHDLLAAVYGWFTEGFDTRDLIEAKALIDELV